MLEPGDLLLVKLRNREGIPCTPDGEVYSDARIKLKDGENPVWEYKNSGDVFPVKMVHNGELVGQWFKLTPTQYHTVYEKWIATLEERGFRIEFDEPLDDAQNETQSAESLDSVPDSLGTSETTESQDGARSTLVEEDDEWSKSKSELMDDLPDL